MFVCLDETGSYSVALEFNYVDQACLELSEIHLLLISQLSEILRAIVVSDRSVKPVASRLSSPEAQAPSCVTVNV